jgi:S-adenosylmethionine/arginine decarboxylase-like enzyme
MHCWPIENTIDIDIFSCYPYDTDKAMIELVEFFGGYAVNTSIIKRGHNLK